MALTTAQLQALKASIAADPVLSALPLTSASAQVIADAYNEPASPAYVVWRTSLSRHEAQSDGFDWTQCDNLTTGQARIWEWIFNTTGSMNPSEPGIRSGITECWKGTAPKVAVATFVLGKCKRNASRAEKLFATGSGSTASPSTMAFEGALSSDDVQQARELP
jgi:hypothetical protein